MRSRSCWITVIRSAAAISHSSGVAFSSWISRLVKLGIICTQACGRITFHSRLDGLRLSAIAASYCARGTELMAPRTTSAPYAPKLRPKATTPQTTGVSSYPVSSGIA